MSNCWSKETIFIQNALFDVFLYNWDFHMWWCDTRPKWKRCHRSEANLYTTAESVFHPLKLWEKWSFLQNILLWTMVLSANCNVRVALLCNAQCVKPLRNWEIKKWVPWSPFSAIEIISDRNIWVNIFCQFHFLSNIWVRVETPSQQYKNQFEFWQACWRMW